ncbi:Peptidoglycan-binding (PGRP) domain of peptidoglycan hydrolases-containing protein [Nannocystis exedens]|uniref:Peptidoglycan-binding (PGRP) domain of peptidoglycan hydrolases-containing protein n=1 Tax=Nannocystis exedens TaxID=54 RepID=A0A1I2IFI5_9BACT|nr:peptidoglycan-binding domain-containing protein [Nannocystis exedens]PCC68237.1 putative peptidoglycan binding domain protein [Nannocystis exedens]SFF40413.1 Peptidoglycan-binding (PGRP) domain of peptidoglycan hydrolases-containing protein [Nannocystis exedens]
MARSPDWEKLAMAQGDPKPAWPLPTVTPKFATWSVGGGRPFGCAAGKCERWHAGIDLTGAPDGALVIAPEDALVVGIDRGWSEGSKAAFLRTKSGLFLVLGGFKAGSHKEYGIVHGQEVRKGDKLGRVLGSYGMIHLETYEAASRTANSVWWESEPPPDGLLNPTNYVERMVGDKVSLLQTRQRHEALKVLGYYNGDVAAAWSSASTEALRAAQTALGIGVDGKWGPETEDAIQRALAQEHGCTTDECSPTSSGLSVGPTTGPLATISRLNWWLVGGVTAAGVALGMMLVVRARD